MISFKSSLVSVILCQLPLLMSLSIKEQAFLLSEHRCNVMNNDMTGAAILLTAAHLVVFGKPIEVLEGSAFGSFSMTVIPYCIVKGDTSEKKILVRNLGKTKCGSSNVESNGQYMYLFFLRNSSDPAIFYALNAGAKVITTPMLWNPQFINYCDVKRKLVCKRSTKECNQRCNFRVRDRTFCDSNERDVSYLFGREYPDGIPPALLTTSAPKTSGTPETSTSRRLTTTPFRLSTSKASKVLVKSISRPAVLLQASTTQKVISLKPSTAKIMIPFDRRSTSKVPQPPIKSTLPPSSLHAVLVTPTRTTDSVTTTYTPSTPRPKAYLPIPSLPTPGKTTVKSKLRESELEKVSGKTGINKAFQNDENKTVMYLPDPKKSVEAKIVKENSSVTSRLGMGALFGALIFHVIIRA